MLGVRSPVSYPEIIDADTWMRSATSRWDRLYFSRSIFNFSGNSLIMIDTFIFLLVNGRILICHVSGCFKILDEVDSILYCYRKADPIHVFCLYCKMIINALGAENNTISVFKKH